ncbi:MAG: TauD/TfdA family dioxygenase [Sphingomonas sp.]|nr:TauD/TfdA family dioxygenase [Sphingomonas sp.]
MNQVLTKPLVSTLKIEPVTPLIGAEVSGIDLRDELAPETQAALRQALLERKVLFFRDQPIDDAQQIRFSRYFGPVTPAHPITNGSPQHPEIMVRRLRDPGSGGDYAPFETTLEHPLRPSPRPRTRAGWHIDITFVANPTSITFLRGVEIPPFGGDTLFADLGGLYDLLSPALRGFLDGLQAIHARDDAADGRPPPRRTDGRAPGPFASLHPLVRVHPETGRKVLFLSGFIRRIENLRASESVALLDYLNAELSGRAELHARFRWTPNALAVWDNRAVAHAGPVDGKLIAGERIVHRTTVAGDLPKGPDGFVSRPLIGELFNTLGA